MDEPTTRHLRALVRRFYSERADAFAASRSRPWPGWQRLLHLLPRDRPARVLDAGCGNGRFGRFLADHGVVQYLGVDTSSALLGAAQRTLEGLESLTSELLEADLLEDRWLDALPGRFDLIALMGVLHHVPAEARRARLLHRLGRRLAPGGHLVATLWQAHREPGFEARVVPWERSPALGRPAGLEAGDTLLGWGEDGGTPRYCHFADEPETERLVDASGLRLVERFRADGPNERSNLYLVLTH